MASRECANNNISSA